MKKNIAIYPGTFDPITYGHVDLVGRATQLFDLVIVAIASNKKKSPLFTLEERIELAIASLSNYKNIVVKGFNNLLVSFAKEEKASVILRGLRAVSDFDFEFQLAGMNRSINSEIETIFMTPSQEYTYLSSSLVREISSLGSDVSQFVPPPVASALLKKFS